MRPPSTGNTTLEPVDTTWRALWVPNWSSASCDLGVFVYQPTEQIARRREAGMVTQALVVTNGRPRVPLRGESRAVERPQSDSQERTWRSSGGDRG
jgi:hypothetical protein